MFCDMRKEEQGGTNDHVAYCHVCDVAGHNATVPFAWESHGKGASVVVGESLFGHLVVQAGHIYFDLPSLRLKWNGGLWPQVELSPCFGKGRLGCAPAESPWAMW